MLLEGTGQLGTVAMNWGDGFATDPAVVTAGHVDDARPFFEKMMTKPYLNNIVISPHLYPPSISTHNEPEVVLAPGLFARLDNSFGYLTKRGVLPRGRPAADGRAARRRRPWHSRFPGVQDLPRCLRRDRVQVRQGAGRADAGRLCQVRISSSFDLFFSSSIFFFKTFSFFLSFHSRSLSFFLFTSSTQSGT